MDLKNISLEDAETILKGLSNLFEDKAEGDAAHKLFLDISGQFQYASQPCIDCGMDGASGLCTTCEQRREAQNAC